MQSIGEIRHAFHRQGESIRRIAKDLNLSLHTVKKLLRG